MLVSRKITQECEGWDGKAPLLYFPDSMFLVHFHISEEWCDIQQEYVSKDLSLPLLTMLFAQVNTGEQFSTGRIVIQP